MENLVPLGVRCARRSNHSVLLDNHDIRMNYLDWDVLIGTIAFIVLYGTWRTRGVRNVEGYLKGDNNLKWWMIGVSIMATQASAVTFLSTPGQAIEDGMRFLQFYIGLPIAMIIIAATIVPIYYRLKVYTAYEYLETRFDVKTRLLAAVLFLFLRGLSCGITLYAPAIVLSTILDVPIFGTTVFIGALVIIYTVSGGTKAVSLTQRQQMAVIMFGMLLAGFLAFNLLPDHVSFTDSVKVAGALGKLNIISTEFNPGDRYNIWSGLVAGTFLFLSYFGTDQSQVARYLGGSSLTESRMGLIFNGLLKIPMQFIILFIGVLVFVFYQFNAAPAFHNQVLMERALKTEQGRDIKKIESTYRENFYQKRHAIDRLVNAIHAHDAITIKTTGDDIKQLQQKENALRDSVKMKIAKAIPGAKTQDRDYIFLNFVLHHLPHGVIGLLLAVMFSAAMSSMASELNALASTTTVDLYKRSREKEPSPEQCLRASRLFTIGWAILAIIFATLATFAENLIQFVNIIGSLFYGTILGIFLMAFYSKRVGGTAVFIAALLAEAIVLYCYFATNIAFLLYNIIGCAIVVVVANIIQGMLPDKRSA